MKMYSGELLITEICVEGVELGYEFECSHSESTELILNKLQDKYNKDGDYVQNLYYNGTDYTVVVVRPEGSRCAIDFDIAFLEPYRKVIDREVEIIL